jgi:Rrf2 family iron-sulfur cluster assembly transcriptional regulator
MPLYSRSTEYAIRALIRLAQVPKGEYAMTKKIAAMENIPSPFLAKILQQLTRKGWLRSCRGPLGGFELRVSPGQISVFDILEAMGGMEPYRRCACGFVDCSENRPCGLHEGWAELQAEVLQYFRNNSVEDLARALEGKRRGAVTRVSAQTS